MLTRTVTMARIPKARDSVLPGAVMRNRPGRRSRNVPIAIKTTDLIFHLNETVRRDMIFPYDV
jgi:hypothetical protein